MAAVRRATGRLSLRERPSEPQLRLQLATEKHRLTRSCACLLFLQAWLSNPRTRSPLLSRRRFWHRFIRDIRVVRCRTGSPSARRRCLGFLNRGYRLRCCCWWHCRSWLCFGLPTQAKFLRQHRTPLRISWSREWMIVPQSPTLPVFIPAQAVLSVNMPA